MGYIDPSPGGAYLAIFIGVTVIVAGVLTIRYMLAPALKKCPDCASSIRRDARVCQHCGYRYGDSDEK